MSAVQTKLHVHDGDVTFERVQDCTPYLERATKLRNEGMHGSSEMRHAAHFPAVLVERYCNQHGITFAEFMQRKEGHVRAMLSDPDLRGFRVWEGRA